MNDKTKTLLKRIGTALGILATIAALAEFGFFLYDRYFAPKETAAITMNIYASDDYVFVPDVPEAAAQPVIGVSAGGTELDGSKIYTIPSDRSVTVTAESGAVSHLWYRIGDGEAVRLQDTTATTFGFGSEEANGRMILLSICGETANGSMTDWRTYAFIPVKAKTKGEALTLLAGGRYYAPGDGSVFEDGSRALCLVNGGKEKIAKVEIAVTQGVETTVTRYFNGFLTIDAPAEGDYTLRVRGVTEKGKELAWQEYKVLRSTLPRMTVSVNGEIPEQRKVLKTSAPAVVKAAVPDGVTAKDIVYKIGTGETVHTYSGAPIELMMPANLTGVDFSFQICYVDADGKQSFWEYYLIHPEK